MRIQAQMKTESNGRTLLQTLLLIRETYFADRQSLTALLRIASGNKTDLRFLIRRKVAEL